MRQLEDQIGAQLFDRSTARPELTPLGRDYVVRARVIIAKIDDLKGLSAHNRLDGTASFGFAPTTLQTILPVIRTQLQTRFANLQVTTRSGFPEELAKAVATGGGISHFSQPRTSPMPTSPWTSLRTSLCS